MDSSFFSFLNIFSFHLENRAANNSWIYALYSSNSETYSLLFQIKIPRNFWKNLRPNIFWNQSILRTLWLIHARGSIEDQSANKGVHQVSIAGTGEVWRAYVHHFWNWVLLLTEKALAPHSSTLAWKIPWTEEPGRLQSMGSLGVGHDWETSLSLFTFMHWRSKWQPTPVFLPGESQGWGILVGFRLWGRTESDTTEVT